MALVFMDGFDYYSPIDTTIAGEIDEHWLFATGVRNARAGRDNDIYPKNLCSQHGEGIFSEGEARSIALGELDEVIVGFAFVWIGRDIENLLIMSFRDCGATQCSLRTNSNSQLILVNGLSGTTQATGTHQLRSSVWYQIELRLVIGDGTGSVQLKLNETDDIHSGGGPVTSLDTQVSANAFMTQVVLQANTSFGTRYDDLYVMNTTASISGPPNNDFIGDHTIETLFADGNGATNDWTPLSGNNWENVDGFMDFGTSYVSTNTPSFIDLYTYDNLVQITQNIKGIQLDPLVIKTTAGSRTFTPLIRHSGINHNGTEVGAYDDWIQQPEIFSANPGTATDWTVSDVNAIEFGVELIS